MPMNDYPCPRCGARCFPEEMTCPSCGVDINQAISEVERYRPISKYPALRTFATAYQILGLAIGIVTLIAAIVSLRQSALVAIVSIVIGLTAVLSFLALSEGIKVFVDIEHNTRTIVALLEARETNGNNAG